ncbi:uncharacterized protein LOC126891406 [Diabrotica virgifera virgifera]|uniref:Uncharacterized protein n=1 Tax=Diabrotica virgifera virgifera TaxID=50390 RepID=A0ABM5L265_DIAVI|nr:uncharacterized protein LOC126891406 [Diabrotica virgifera virgifera]
MQEYNFQTISEMKTKIKRRVREVRYGYQGTGGGGGIKPLTPVEERLLALLVSEVSIEGAQLAKAGVEMIDESFETPIDIEIIEVEQQPSTSPLHHVPPPRPSSTESTITNPVTQPQPKKAKTVGTSARRGSRRTPPRGRNRVSSAMEVHYRQLANLAMSNYAIASAINRLARAIAARR